jgi:hypothetical protein
VSTDAFEGWTSTMQFSGPSPDQGRDQAGTHHRGLAVGVLQREGSLEPLAIDAVSAEEVHDNHHGQGLGDQTVVIEAFSEAESGACVLKGSSHVSQPDQSERQVELYGGPERTTVARLNQRLQQVACALRAAVSLEPDFAQDTQGIGADRAGW